MAPCAPRTCRLRPAATASGTPSAGIHLCNPANACGVFPSSSGLTRWMSTWARVEENRRLMHTPSRRRAGKTCMEGKGQFTELRCADHRPIDSHPNAPYSGGMQRALCKNNLEMWTREYPTGQKTTPASAHHCLGHYGIHGIHIPRRTSAEVGLTENA